MSKRTLTCSTVKSLFLNVTHCYDYLWSVCVYVYSNSIIADHTWYEITLVEACSCNVYIHAYCPRCKELHFFISDTVLWSLTDKEK